MEENINKGYYRIRKPIIWIAITMVVVLVTMMVLKILYLQDMNHVKAEYEKTDTFHMEYGSLESKLDDIEECYLCGNAQKSLMGYYRKFDTVGVIGLNDWYVLDLRLKEYDEAGNPVENSSGTSMSFGNTSGIDFNLNGLRQGEWQVQQFLQQMECLKKMKSRRISVSSVWIK